MMQERTPPAKLQLRALVVIGLIVTAALARLLPYAVPEDSGLWNFQPVIAVALFAGARFVNRWAAFFVPLAIMVLSDLLLHLSGLAPLTNGWEVLQQLATYLVLFLVVGIGLGVQWCEERIRRRLPDNVAGRVKGFLASLGLIGGATVGSAVVFFLISNFVVWLTASATMPPAFQYPRTLAGLIQCYVMALPFFSGTFWGNVYFAGLLFGGFGLAQLVIPGLKERTPAVAASATVA
jgi:hypothetical protein